MADNTVNINIKTTVDQSKSALTTLKKSWTELNSALGVVQTGFAAVSKVLDETVGDYMRQAQAVRELSLATGTSADETSRLIQVFDDAGINTDNLRGAMEAMRKDGVTPTIDAIATMADEYRALQTPLEKSTYLTEKFGTRGKELGKVFDQTGAQIREAGKAVDESLIFDEKKIAAAEELRKAEDNLNDSLQALKNEAIAPLIPLLADLATRFTDFIAVQKQGTTIWDKYGDSAVFWIDTAQDLVSVTKQVSDGTKVLGVSAVSAYDAQNQLTKSTEDLTNATNIAGASFDQYNTAINNVTGAWAENEQAVKDVEAANAAMFEALDAGVSSSIDKTLEKIAFLNAGGANLQKAFEDAYAALVKDPGDPAAQQRVMELYAASQALKVTLGEIDATEAAQNIADTLGIALSDAYIMLSDLKNDLAKGSELVVNVRYNDPGFTPGGYNPWTNPKTTPKTGSPSDTTTPPEDEPEGSYAMGGEVREGSPSLVGEKGPEIFIPSTNGRILSNSDTKQALSGGGTSYNIGTVIIQAAPGMSGQAIYQAMADAAARAKRSGVGSG